MSLPARNVQLWPSPVKPTAVLHAMLVAAEVRHGSTQ